MPCQISTIRPIIEESKFVFPRTQGGRNRRQRQHSRFARLAAKGTRPGFRSLRKAGQLVARRRPVPARAQLFRLRQNPSPTGLQRRRDLQFAPGLPRLGLVMDTEARVEFRSRYDRIHRRRSQPHENPSMAQTVGGVRKGRVVWDELAASPVTRLAKRHPATR